MLYALTGKLNMQQIMVLLFTLLRVRYHQAYYTIAFATIKVSEAKE